MWNQGDPEATELLAQQWPSQGSFQSSRLAMGLVEGRQKGGNRAMRYIVGGWQTSSFEVQSWSGLLHVSHTTNFE